MVKRAYIGQLHTECRAGAACVALKKDRKLIAQHAQTFLPFVRKRTRAYSSFEGQCPMVYLCLTGYKQRGYDSISNLTKTDDKH